MIASTTAVATIIGVCALAICLIIVTVSACVAWLDHSQDDALRKLTKDRDYWKGEAQRFQVLIEALKAEKVPGSGG